MHNTKTSARVIRTAFLLVFISYMTLTLSLALAGHHVRNFPVSATQFQFGLSALFFLFSLSAIALSRAADLIGPYRILCFAQPVSILGLVVVACATNYWVMLIGLCLMGLGTGCYSSIARLLVAINSSSHHEMRKNFSVFSILIVVAPLASGYLMLFSSQVSWRIGYAVMAAIEIVLLLKVIVCLKPLPEPKGKFTLTTAISGYTYCLKRFRYVLNMVIIGVGMSLIVSTFLGSSHQLLINHFGISYTLFTILNILITLCYVLGILIIRFLPENFPYIKLRALFALILAVALIWFSFSRDWLDVILSIYLASFCLGIVIPITTSAGLTIIKEHHGAAAALYTFSFALVSSVWSIVRNYLNTTTSNYILCIFIISTLIIISLTTSSFFMKIRREKTCDIQNV